MSLCRRLVVVRPPHGCIHAFYTEPSRLTDYGGRYTVHQYTRMYTGYVYISVMFTTARWPASIRARVVRIISNSPPPYFGFCGGITTLLYTITELHECYPVLLCTRVLLTSNGNERIRSKQNERNSRPAADGLARPKCALAVFDIRIRRNDV